MIPLLLVATTFLACNDSDSDGQTANTDSTAVVPVAEGCNDPAVMEKIKKATSFEMTSGLEPQEAAEWLSSNERPKFGLEGYGLNTLYDEHCVSSYRVTLEWMGAYPSTQHVFLNFDKRTGDALPIGAIVDPAKINALVAKCDQQLQANIVSNKESRKNEPEEIQILNEKFSENPPKFTAEHLNTYFIEGDEIVFVYPFDFPHVIQALEPDGYIRLKKAEFNSFIHKDGPLAFWL